MAIEHLPQLDGIASTATLQRTCVYIDDLFPIHLKGLADWSPTGHYFVITLNPALLTWQCIDLEAVFYHECSHCRLGHVNTSAKAEARAASYRRLVQKASLGQDEEFYTTLGAVLREQEADAESRRLRSTWPFSGYRLWRLIQRKEVFPWQLYMTKLPK